MATVVCQGTSPIDQYHLQIDICSTASNSSGLRNMRHVGPVHLTVAAAFISFIKLSRKRNTIFHFSSLHFHHDEPNGQFAYHFHRTGDLNHISHSLTKLAGN